MFEDITIRLQEYLEQVSTGKAPPIDDTIIEAFGEKCKQTLRDFVTPQPFRLRMSNIGSGARKLYLDKRDERETFNTQFLVKGTYGHIIEHFFVAILNAAGVETGPNDRSVTLKLDDNTEIRGSYDAKIPYTDWRGNTQDYIFDFKTASQYSYERKFTSLESLREGDSFGYIDQAIGYSQADGTPFGGWFVINTGTGAFKIVDGRELNSKEDVESSLSTNKSKIAKVAGDTLPEPCHDPEPEVFNKQLTGRMVLDIECSYCPHKFTCFPDVNYRPVIDSKAKNPPYAWYVGLEDNQESTDNDNTD